MAEGTGNIDALDIQIKSSADKATSELEGLAAVLADIKSLLAGLSAATKGASDSLDGAASSAEEASEGVGAVKREAAGLGKSFSKTSGPIDKFIKSIGRIALYRAIRTAIKNISAAVREGLTNLETYSRTVGTAFAPAVDNLRQHVLLLKNAFATALRPVIEALIPIIIRLVDWLSKAADFVAQVLSVLTGKVDANGRYTKAVLSDLQQSNKQ